MKVILRHKFYLVLIALVSNLSAHAADEASTLRDKYKSLILQLNQNQFHRQLHLNSSEISSTIKGDIYAVVDYPFATVNGSLNDAVHGPDNWCDVLMLHLNTKYCNVSASDDRPVLKMGIGKKTSSSTANVYDLQFNYHPVASTPEYFKIDLNADIGPLGTKDYRIVLEAVAIDNRRTFLHMTYSYSYGVTGRLAMKTYLATIGRGKVGFTKVNDGTKINPNPTTQGEYIGGIRGVIERNTMRYYLAIDAYLSGLSATPDKQLNRRLVNWFDATEQYSRQLHEIEREKYMAMKHEQNQSD